MVETTPNVNHERNEAERLDIKQILDRERGIDLLHVDTKALSLRERLRQRRQREAAGLIFSQSPHIHPVPQRHIPTAPVHIKNLRENSTETPENTTPQQKEEEIQMRVKAKDTQLQRKKEYKSRQDGLERRFNDALAGYESLLSRNELNAITTALNDPSIKTTLSEKEKNRLETLVHNARKKIENKLLEPAGIYPLRRLSEETNKVDNIKLRSLSNAVARRSLPAVIFLNKAYSTPEMVFWFEKTKVRTLNEKYKNADLESLSSVFSKKDARAITNNPYFSQYIIESNGVYYLKKEDIPKINSLLNPPNSEYRSLSEIASTPTERTRLKTAIQRGRIDHIKRRRKFMITSEALDAYNQSVDETYINRRK